MCSACKHTRTGETHTHIWTPQDKCCHFLDTDVCDVFLSCRWTLYVSSPSLKAKSLSCGRTTTSAPSQFWVHVHYIKLLTHTHPDWVFTRFGCRCVKTYEVEFSKDGVIFERINFRDTVFTSHTFSPGELDYTYIHTPLSHICTSLQILYTSTQSSSFVCVFLREPGRVWILQSKSRGLLGTSRTIFSYWEIHRFLLTGKHVLFTAILDIVYDLMNVFYM